MFWHPYYAAAIQAAGEAGAKVVALDHAFGIPVDKWEPDIDRVLGEAVSTSPIPVVCGYATTLNSNQESQRVPINMLAAALGLSAFANLTADPDDFVRRQELIEAGETPARSLAFRVVEKYLGVDSESRGGRLTLQGRPIPISGDRSIFINYAGPAGTFPRVSIAEVVSAQRGGRKDQLRKWFNAKIVLIGSDSLEDRRPTPFYTSFSGTQWTTAGVEIHANTIRTLLDRRFVLPVPEWARITGLLATTAATVGIATSVAAGTAAVWIVLELLVALALTDLLFRTGWILSSSEVLIAGGMCLLASVIYRNATAEKRGNLFRKAISLFVGRELATSLEDTQTIGLTGKRETVTILFTDIRGFTAFSERICDEQGPEVVVQLLNEYMSTMVSIIVKYHGHVNKFIGDGILAVFSDDNPGVAPGDHPLRAVRCATEMVTAPGRFETGAGIHTGLAVIGNVGSSEKMEYTVLGDTVNLASRLESLNKEHKTRLLMTDVTCRLLGDEVNTMHLGTTAVRGKAVPIDLYTVASLVVSPKVEVNA